jgi:hypothetical protein
MSVISFHPLCVKRSRLPPFCGSMRQVSVVPFHSGLSPWRRALDGLQRENPEFERAASPQFRAEAQGHCNDILHLMLEIATGQAAGLGPDPFHFVRTHAVRRARQQFPLAGSLNAYRSPTEAIGR